MQVINYMIGCANIINEKDEVIILVDAETKSLYKDKVPPNILLEADVDHIWIRDYASVIPSKQVKFKYSPTYHEKSLSDICDKRFENWFSKSGLKYHIKSDIILDGGNVVENVVGTRVIVTDRILQDNPSLTKMDAKNKLKELLGVKEVAIIPEPPNHTTGHSDGSVIWPMDDKIILLKKEEPIHTAVVNELKTSFPNVEIVEMHNYIPNIKVNNFDTALNCYVNCIVTNNYIYMPSFNTSYDAEMMEFIKSHTNKTVVSIPAEHVADLGGSVRCLSWQVEQANKTKILQLLKQ